MMMMRTGRIKERRAVEGTVLAMAMAMMTARVRRTRRAVRKEPGNVRERRVGRGNGWQLRTGWGRGRQRRKGRGRGRGRGRGSGMGMGKGKELLNKPYGVNARRAVERPQGTRGIRHGGLTRAVIFIAGSITNRVNSLR